MGSTAMIRGFALSGAPDIAKVDVAVKVESSPHSVPPYVNGEPWESARLEPDHDPYAWRLWNYAWKPAIPGKFTLFARATDSQGSVQPKDAIWNQSGYLYNGWHSVTIEVTE